MKNFLSQQLFPSRFAVNILLDKYNLVSKVFDPKPTVKKWTSIPFISHKINLIVKKELPRISTKY